jgi:hypothetical protein
MVQSFRPHPIYRWLTVGCLLLSGLLGWSLIQSLTTATFFFWVVSIGATLWFATAMWSRVQIDERTVVLQRPFRALCQVEFRQLVSVAESGRMTQALLLLYHPRQPDNLVDLDQIHSLLLPAVIDQEKLLTTIEARIPK